MSVFKNDSVPGLVTVIIPTCKRALNLYKAVNSILEQTYKDIEIIVVDDNNEGDEYRRETSKIMEQFANSSNVIYLKHEINKNGSAARNTGINASRGEYIAFMDDDDLSLSNRIEKSVKALKSSSDKIGAVCVNYVKRYDKLIYKVGHFAGVYSDCSRLLAKEADFSPGSTIMYKRECVENVGYYDVSYKKHQDWEYLIRLFRRYSLLVIDDVEVVINAGVIGNRANLNVVIDMKTKLLSEFKDDIHQLGSVYLSRIHNNQWRDVYLSYLKQGDYSNARLFRKGKTSEFSLGAKDLILIIQAVIEHIYPKSMWYIYYYYDLRNKAFSHLKNI